MESKLHSSADASQSGDGFFRVLSPGPRWSTTQCGSSGEGGTTMIESDAQRDPTLAQIEGSRQALAKVEQEKPGKRFAAIRGSYESMIRQLEDELREYDRLKSGELPPNVGRLDQIVRFIAKIRIPKGLRKRNWRGGWA
jgi:hypothetical protein